MKPNRPKHMCLPRVALKDVARQRAHLTSMAQSLPGEEDRRGQSAYGCRQTAAAAEAPSEGREDLRFQTHVGTPRHANPLAGPWRALCSHLAMPKPVPCLHTHTDAHTHSRVGDHTKACHPASWPIARSIFAFGNAHAGALPVYIYSRVAGITSGWVTTTQLAITACQSASYPIARSMSALNNKHAGKLPAFAWPLQGR